MAWNNILMDSYPSMRLAGLVIVKESSLEKLINKEQITKLDKEGLKYLISPKYE